MTLVLLGGSPPSIFFHPYCLHHSFRFKSLVVKSVPQVSAARRDVWTRTRQSLNSPHHGRNNHPAFLDHSVDMSQLLSSISQTQNEQELYALLSPFKDRQLSIRFLVTLISRETDWQRSLALLDWINDVARYSPSVFAYNVTLRNIMRAEKWELAYGLFDEMRQRGAFPDRYTYSILISSFGKSGKLEASLFWLHQMENDKVSGDLVLYSNLIELARKLSDYSKAISIFTKLKRTKIIPDVPLYNSMIHIFGKAKLIREARMLLQEMKGAKVEPNTGTYSTLLSVYAEEKNFVEALMIFEEMNEAKCPMDLTTCNIMIDVYGQMDMAKEADELFWGMRKNEIEPNVVSYNTLLRVYGDAELYGEAVHLFRLMQRKEVKQNVVTYNTMIKIYGKSLDHEKASNLIQEMQNRGIEPNVITYSTIISIWSDVGRLDKAAALFEKLRDSGLEIDEVLYETMVAAYEKAGLVKNAKELLREVKSFPKGVAVKVLAKAGRVDEALWVFREACDVKEISVYKCLVELCSNGNRFENVVEVFEKMRGVGLLPDSGLISAVVNAYGKLREFEKVYGLCEEMREEGCVFEDEVYFQMLSVCGEGGNLEMVDTLLRVFDLDPRINKKNLHVVASSLYHRGNKMNS